MLTKLKSMKGSLFLLIALCAVLAWCFFEARAVPANYQRIFLPTASQTTGAGGDVKPDNGLRAARESAKTLEEALEGICEKTALYSLTQPAAVSAKDSAGANARLIGINESYYGIRDFTLYCGRLIYPDELQNAERVAMLDEQLAVALFKYAEPLGQKIIIDGAEYEIIGVLRAGKRVGMQQDYSLYIPYRAIERSGEPVTALVFEVAPIAGAGGWSGFESEAKTLGTTGTSISLVKERMNATMPTRVALCALGFWLGFALIKLLTAQVKRLSADYSERLKLQYATRLIWRILPRAMLLLLGYAACAAVLAALFAYLIQPVYTFPEWVPAVLVEPSDISVAFWNVWQTSAAAVELRTAELLRLRFLRELCFWCTLLAGAVPLHPTRERRL